MESANLYEHHQLQTQLLYSSLASSSSSSHGVSGLHDWNTSNFLDKGYEFNRYMNEILPNWPSAKGPSLQEIRFGDARSYVHPPANSKLQYENINGSTSDNFLKFSDMNRSTSSFNSYSYIKNEHRDQDEIDLNENLSWLTSFPKQNLSSSESYSNGESFGVPAGGASASSSFMSSCTDHSNNLYASSSILSSSSPSLQLAPDHILSYRNGVEGSIQSFEEKNSLSYFHVQQSTHSPSNSSSNKTSIFRNEASRTEKLSACSTTHEVAAKKPRLSSSSCASLKVRKEKLGDRIAALHRLVSPFGKTDTASVLTEAIGYIQFLQDQIQTLSMSYLKSSSKKSCRTIQGGLTMKDDDHQHQKEDHEPNIHEHLRSRGLCLVPLAFSSYI